VRRAGLGEAEPGVSPVRTLAGEKSQVRVDRPADPFKRGAAIVSVQSAFNAVVNVSGLLFAAFYILTALATMAYYRRRVLASAWDAIVLGILPLGAAGSGPGSSPGQSRRLPRHRTSHWSPSWQSAWS
jgi:hypothetical protein